jgi:hypothetical protein
VRGQVYPGGGVVAQPGQEEPRLFRRQRTLPGSPQLLLRMLRLLDPTLEANTRISGFNLDWIWVWVWFGSVWGLAGIRVGCGSGRLSERLSGCGRRVCVAGDFAEIVALTFGGLLRG